MSTPITLAAEPRGFGSAVSRRLRRAGRVPAVVYGSGTDPVAVSVNLSDLARLVSRHGRGMLVQLAVAGDPQPRQVMVKDLQHHLLTQAISHVDFLQVDVSKPIRISVPVILAGDDLVRKRGLILTQQVNEVEVECRPGDVPPGLTLDLSEVSEPGALTAAQLTVPNGLKLLTDPETVVVSCSVPSTAATADGEEVPADSEAAATSEESAG